MNELALLQAGRAHHESQLREAEINRLLKEANPGRCGRRAQVALIIAGYLISVGQVLKERYQPASHCEMPGQRQSA